MAGAPLGNQNAVKGKMFEQALKMTLAKRPAALLNIADNLVTQAEAGEQWAVQMVADRLDGKAKQQIEATGAEGVPLVFTLSIADKKV